MPAPRDKKGRFIKGYQYGVEHQFKKGQMSWAKNRIVPKEVREKQSIAHRNMSDETRERIRLGMIRRISDKTKHPRWVADRSKLAKRQERNDSAYAEWRKEVWLRDNFKCKIDNPDCCGKIEAHHILSWRGYPDLRYKPNNGITLCHAHHPRRRSEEKRLSSYFQSLVPVSKE